MTIPVYLYVNLICIIIWFVFKSRFADKRLLDWGPYFIFLFLTETSAWCYSKFLHLSNHWIYNVINFVQFMWLFYLYRKIILNEKKRKFIKSVLILFPVLYVADIFLVQSFWSILTYLYCLSSLLIIYLCVLYFRDLLGDATESLSKLPFFWISIGLIIFFAGSMFYMGSINYILSKRIDTAGKYIGYLVYSFTAVQYIFIAIGLLCNLKPSRKYFL